MSSPRPRTETMVAPIVNRKLVSLFPIDIESKMTAFLIGGS